MRELTSEEIEEVSGGVLNLAAGALGAAVGGLAAGGAYAINGSRTGDFAWGGFTYAVATSATAGFLIGTGGALIMASASGALPGAHVLGVTLSGAGAIIEVTTNLEEPRGDGGS